MNMNLKSIPREWLYVAIRVLSLSALIFASMLAVDYYMTANTFCHAGASCEVVAKSAFGQKYGIFLPTLGLAAYSFFFLTSFFFAKTSWKIFGKSVRSFWNPLAIICCAIGAMLFIIVQAIEINAFCWLCMGIDTSAILMTIPAALLMIGDKSEQSNRPTFIHPVIWIALYLGIVSGPLSWGTYHPPVIDTSVATDDLATYQQRIEEKVPEFIRSKYVKGKINVYEISSFGCPHCKRLHPELNALLAQYGDKINFHRTTLPIHMSQDACAAYHCAQKQGKADQFADCMFDEPPKDAQTLLKHAQSCELPQEDFIQCIQSEETQKAIAADQAAIEQCNFKGAPTVWIDAQSIIGYNPQNVYKQAIELNPILQKKTVDVKEPSVFETKPVLFTGCMSLSALILLIGLALQFKSSANKKTLVASSDDSSNAVENVDENADAEASKTDDSSKSA